MKYWNARRILRKKKKQSKRTEHTYQASREREALTRIYTKGDTRKNARLMLDVLGSAIHRRMLARLRRQGVMSVSHLARPFNIMLPDAMRHVHILEQSGLITTEKRGRIRFCVYNPAAPKELSAWLSTRHPFELD